MHVATICVIATDAAIAINTTIPTIETAMIAVLVIDPRTGTSTMLMMIATRIARAINIAITRITSTMEAIAIKKPITIIDQTVAKGRTTMPCTLMLAAVGVALAHAASPPLRAH